MWKDILFLSEIFMNMVAFLVMCWHIGTLVKKQNELDKKQYELDMLIKTKKGDE